MNDKIKIKGARQHNLKNISIELPRDKLIVITGLSGSGKSTLAFDTLYAEGQRRYVESLSSYARQFLGLMSKPDVDSIEGLSPAISIEQKTTSKNPRSTVGTVTEIYDYLRLLYARIGIPHCPIHNIKIEAQSPEKISQKIAEDFTGQVTILSPIIRQQKGTYEQLFLDLNKEGYARVRVNGHIFRTDETIKLERYKKHDIEVIIDRLDVKDKSRLAEAVENALIKSKGLLIVENNGKILVGKKIEKPSKFLSSAWHIPGGKLDKNETEKAQKENFPVHGYFSHLGSPEQPSIARKVCSQQGTDVYSATSRVKAPPTHPKCSICSPVLIFWVDGI